MLVFDTFHVLIDWDCLSLSKLIDSDIILPAKMTASIRDPYPFPKLQNDDDFRGIRTTEKIPYGEPTHMAQTQNPWNRLNTRCTLSSSRREVYHFDPLAPRDSLDFVLKSQYDHHNEFLRARSQTLVQPETAGLPHGRTLKNRIPEVPAEVNPLNHPLKQYNVQKKEVIHSIHNAIESHHSAATNRGYSRKHDGGFYNP